MKCVTVWVKWAGSRDSGFSVAVSFQTDLQPLSGYKIEEIQTSYGYFC